MVCACVVLHKLGIIMAFNMADEREEIPETHCLTNELNINYRKMRQTHEVAGYREGMEAGKEVHLQQGFNQGFAYAAYISRKCGTLRGALSALMSLVIKKCLQDSSPNILTEITELLAKVTQMEGNALDTQTLQHTLENRMNQTLSHSTTFEPQNNSKGDETLRERNDTQKQQVDGNELSSAFEMLGTGDTADGVGDLEVEPERVEGRIETGCSLQDTTMDVVSDEHSIPLELPETVTDDLEMLWSRTLLLADKIGINREKILFVKCI